MVNMHDINSLRGSLTLELLIALSFFLSISTSVLLLVSGTQTAHVDTELTLEAVSETARNVTLGHIARATSFTSPLPHPISDDVFARTLTETLIAPCITSLQSRSTWNAEHNRVLNTARTSLQSLPAEAHKYGGGCDPFPPSDWDNASMLSMFNPTDSGIPSGIIATGIVTRSIQNVRYAFVTTRHTDPAVSDFWIIDITDPLSPTLVSSLDTNQGNIWPGGGVREGLNGVVIVGDYAYVIRNFNRDQLQVIDISEPDTPTIVREISLDTYGVSPTGSDPQGNVIHYFNNRLYLGLKTTIGPELFVFSLSIPSIPSLVGAVDQNFNHSINDIAATEDYLYLASGYDIGEIAIVPLTSLDTNPVTLTTITYVDMPSGEDARALYLLGNMLYVGRDGSVQPAKKDFYVYELATPTALSFQDAENINLKSSVRITDIHVQGSHAFITTTHQEKELQVWDVSDPAAMTPHGCVSLDLSVSPAALSYSENRLMTANVDDEILYVFEDETYDHICN